MKCLAVLLLSAGGGLAADFATGQAARAVIGQPTFTAQSPTSSDVVLGAASGLAYASGMLVVADSNRIGASPSNNRVLIYNNINQQIPGPTAVIPIEGLRCPVCGGDATVVVGQKDFTSSDPGLNQTSLQSPTAVATDGVRLVVADTDNNRVLIWNHIPATNDMPADLVLGQKDFTSNSPNAGTGDSRVPSASSMRGPQGVWIQNNKLFVADDQNHRVLIWNSFPNQNNQPADLVLGQPNFSTAIEPDLTKTTINAAANTLLNPVSVSSDGQHLFVADLGHNRVLIWNSIPTQNQAPADVEIGQPDMTTAIANYTGQGGMCASNGTDSSGNPTYPSLCGSTLDFPRFALSDGSRLFVADGGNDRVLVFNQIPTTNAASADAVLGQISDQLEQTSDTPDNPDSARISASDSVRTPMSLAWDGSNLYVSEPYSRRILVFSGANTVLPQTAVRNSASQDVFAVGSVTIGGTIKASDTVTITIRGTDYKYTIQSNDTIDSVIDALVALINAGSGDPWVLATPSHALSQVLLTSRIGGSDGNSTSIATTLSTNAVITASTSGANLSGGQDAAKIAPGTIVSIFVDAADQTAAADLNADPLPRQLGGVQVYFDGIRAPLLSVTPSQINAQVPWEINDATSISAWVRAQHQDGSVVTTTAIGVPIIPANPGIFAQAGTDPRPAVAVHASSQASGTILIDGTAKGGDVVHVTIEDRDYSYTVVDGDTLDSIRDALIPLVNQDPKVTAFAAGQFSRIRLRARIDGPEGNGIPISASASENAQVIMGTTNTALCCANVAGAPVNDANPAVPGETIIVYATGLGFVQPDEAKFNLDTGFTYKGPVLNVPNESVSSLAGGKTANVLYCGAKQGTVGLYEVDLELNADMPSNPATQLTIAQDIYVSNIVTIPVVNPNPTSP